MIRVSAEAVHPRRTRLRLVIVAAVAITLMSACSSGGSDGPATPSGTPTGPYTYTDPDYGFSVTAAPPFQQGGENNIAFVAEGNNPPARSVMFYDTKSSVSKESPPAGIPSAESSAIAKQLPADTALYPVTFMVSVFPLEEAVTSANLAVARAELEKNVLSQFEQSGLKPGPLKPTTVAGRPAFSSELLIGPRDTGTGQTMRTQMYWVFGDQNEYQVTQQAPTTEWDEQGPAFDAMLKSLTLPGTWASATPSGSASASPSTSG